MKMDLFSDDFLGNLVIMIIGLVILGIGAQVFISGAYIPIIRTPDVILMVVLMIVGVSLIAFGLRILLNLVTNIHRKIRS